VCTPALLTATVKLIKLSVTDVSSAGFKNVFSEEWC